jgi:hypothetical protein
LNELNPLGTVPLTTPVVTLIDNHEGAPARANVEAGYPPSAVAVAEYDDPTGADFGPEMDTEVAGVSTTTTTWSLTIPTELATMTT